MRNAELNHHVKEERIGSGRNYGKPKPSIYIETEYSDKVTFVLTALKLKIKSYWSGHEAVCTWKPSAHHMAGPKQVLNGGIIATVIDCHSG